MENEKLDLKNICGFSQKEMWRAYLDYEISEADYDVWFDSNCGQCIWGNDGECEWMNKL